ncbi:MAG: pyruvate kinase, partial [Phycisphaerae bacterium]
TSSNACRPITKRSAPCSAGSRSPI